MVKMKSKIYVVIPLILLVVVFAPLFSSCKNLTGPSTIENVHWESIDGPELSFDYINYDDSFGTLTYNNEVKEIYFSWINYEVGYAVFSPNYIEFINTIGVDDEKPWTTYLNGQYKDFDSNNLTITILISYDNIFDNEYTEIHLQGTRIAE